MEYNDEFYDKLYEQGYELTKDVNSCYCTNYSICTECTKGYY